MGKYTLIITEKPDAAMRIARAIDEKEKPRKMLSRGMPYYVARKDGEIVVVPSLGHLYTIAEEKGKREHYPVFVFRWVPRYLAERNARQIRSWLETISELAKDAETFIDACDYDIEGCIIGYNILKYACIDKEALAQRMKYSTLTKEEIKKSYATRFPHLDFALIEAGRTRHEVDWLYGINLSRALTAAAKNWSGKYTTLSIGRVQGPLLKFIAEKTEDINSFVPTPYWEIRAEVEIDGQTFEAHHERAKIETKCEADAILRSCEGKQGTIEKTKIQIFDQNPPLPLDLGALQNEAYRLFGYTPKHTSEIAQRLYLDALISYPRTGSQKLPQAIGYETILRKLSRASEYRKLTAELLTKHDLRPREGKKEDPAHPAIYPTGDLSTGIMDHSEKDIWDLVVRRFMAVFAQPATRQNVEIGIKVNGQHFSLRGGRTIKDGWLRFHRPYTRTGESVLPLVEEGQPVAIRRVILDSEFTKPPLPYNPSSILRKMEKAKIGTKATRADIMQTLVNRKYVKARKMIVTDIGFEVLAVMEKYCPTIVSTEFTRELEERMNNIYACNENREGVVDDTIELLRPVIQDLKDNERTIGKRLGKSIRKSRPDEKTLGICPVCQTGRLTIMVSRRTGKRFVGCTNYFKGQCKASFPLPQSGNVRPYHRDCQRCGWPTVRVDFKRKHLWALCINPQCPSKRERKKKIEVQNMQ